MNPSPSTRVERKKEETTQRIIHAAIRLFNQHGLKAVTMEQIAEAADVAKGTLYNYFPFKEAIITAFLQRTSRERNPERIEQLRRLPDTRQRMVLVFNLLVQAVLEQKELFEAFWIFRMKQVISFQPVPGEKTGLYELVEEIIRLGQAGGDLRSDLPYDLLEGLFEFAFIETIKPLYLDPDGYDKDRGIDRCVDLFLHGAGA